MNQVLPGDEDVFKVSYVRLRIMTGIVGILLPFVLIIGKWIFESWGIQSSISAYYYTVMRNLFVGGLFAIGVFFISNRIGRPDFKRDNFASALAGFFAICVALLPTTPATNITMTNRWIGNFHLLSAGCFFGILSYISLKLFTKTNKTNLKLRQYHRKRWRNRIYWACGIIMIFCIVLIILVQLLPDDAALKKYDPVFWLETLAIVAFGVSWLYKSGAILEGKNNRVQKILKSVLLVDEEPIVANKAN
jgi:predicted cobalt transporter CbtA